MPDDSETRTSVKRREKDNEQPKQKKVEVPRTLETVLAGGFAGCVSKSCTAPLERTQMLLQTGASHSGIFATMRHIIETSGVRGFWRGNFVNCVRIFPHKSVLFATNDYLRHHLSVQSSSISFLTGALSGIVATSVTYPIDLVRATLAGTYESKATTMSIAKDVLRQRGVFGFYRGLFVTLCGTFPYEGCRIGVYSVLRDYIPVIQTNFGEQPHPLGKLAAGAAAGACAGTLTYPSDTLRRMLQVQGHGGLPEHSSVLACIKHTVRNEGILRFYSGLNAKLIRVIPDAAILFLAYESIKDYLLNVYSE